MRIFSSDSGNYRPHLQGLRALAVTLVVLYHANFSVPQTFAISGGFVGVDVFFVLSGFVVGGVLLRELHSTGTIAVGRFLRRRAARLLPASGLLVAVTGIAAFFTVSLEAIQDTVRTAVASTLFSANLSLWASSQDYFDTDTTQNPLLHMWSLSLEEQVYGFFALALVLAVAARRSGLRLPRFVGLKLLVFSLFSMSLTFLVFAVASDGSGHFYSPLTRAWQFLLGVLVYIATEKAAVTRVREKLLAFLMILVGPIAILYAAIFFTDSLPYPHAYAALPSIGTALVLAGAKLHPESWLIYILRLRPLVFLGNLSYSWYLWHWPFVVFSDFWLPENDEAALLMALAALIPAYLSFVFVERPFRERANSGIVFSRSFWSLVLVLPLIAAGALQASSNAAFEKLEAEGSFLATVKNDQAEIEALLRTPSETSSPIDYVLVGDSHASSMATGLSRAAEDYGKTVGLLSQGRGCLLLKGPYTGTPDEDCESWQNETLEQLRESEIETVVLHGYATGRITGFNRGSAYRYEITSATGEPAQTYATALALYRSGLTAAVDELVEAGKKIVILTTYPDFTQRLPTDQAENRTNVWQVLSGNYPQILFSDIEVVALEDARERNYDLLQIEQAVSNLHTEVVSIDLSAEICPGGECRQWRDGQLVYSDLDHITSQEALRLGRILLARIEQ